MHGILGNQTPCDGAVADHPQPCEAGAYFVYVVTHGTNGHKATHIEPLFLLDVLQEFVYGFYGAAMLAGFA